MNETILILKNLKEIDQISMQYLWATSFVPDNIRILRVVDENAAKNLLTKMEFENIDNITLPLLLYGGKIFTNLESIGSTVTRDLRFNLAQSVIDLLRDTSNVYYINDNEKITLNEDVIQSNGGAIYEDKSKIRIGNGDEIFLTVWSMENKSYVEVDITGIKK